MMILGICGELSSGKSQVAFKLSQISNFEVINLNKNDLSLSFKEDLLVLEARKEERSKSKEMLDEKENTILDLEESTTIELNSLVTTPEKRYQSKEIALKGKHLIFEDQDNRSSLSKVSIKQYLKDFSKCYIIYPFHHSEVYEDLKLRTNFRLVHVKASFKKRYSNYNSKYGKESIEDFIEKDEELCSDNEFQRIVTLANYTIYNNADLTNLEFQVKSLFSQSLMPIRPNWDSYFFSVAEMLANRANCIKLRVGAIVVKNKRIIGTGYNGTPAKLKNCFEGGCQRCYNSDARQGEDLDKCICIHAEESAILEVGTKLCEEATLYSTVYPCMLCAKVIIQSGITRVVYGYSYNSSLSKVMFDEAKIEIVKYKPNDTCFNF